MGDVDRQGRHAEQILYYLTDSTSTPPLMLEAYEIMQLMRVNGC